MERTRPVREELDGNMFISRQIHHFSSVHFMIEVLFSIFTVKWRVNNYVSSQKRDKLEKQKYKGIIIVLICCSD